MARMISHTQLSLNRLQKQLFIAVPPHQNEKCGRARTLPPFCYHFMSEDAKRAGFCRKNQKNETRRRISQTASAITTQTAAKAMTRQKSDRSQRFHRYSPERIDALTPAK